MGTPPGGLYAVVLHTNSTWHDGQASVFKMGTFQAATNAEQFERIYCVGKSVRSVNDVHQVLISL